MTGCEEVILLAEDGRQIGTMPKAAVHGPQTPLHLAFSFYGFNDDGLFVETRRSRTKTVFPGVRTNTCCGHPSPGEDFEVGIIRRVRQELGLVAYDIKVAMADFRYRAEMNGIVENEMCPVFLGRVSGTPALDALEVDSMRETTWEEFTEAVLHPTAGEQYSPWAILQVQALKHSGLLDVYRTKGSSREGPA